MEGDYQLLQSEMNLKLKNCDHNVDSFGIVDDGNATSTAVGCLNYERVYVSKLAKFNL